jgi:putative transposase
MLGKFGVGLLRICINGWMKPVDRYNWNMKSPLLQAFFWTATDLETYLREYQCYYNERRTHSGRNGETPVESTGKKFVDINQYRWQKHCRGLFQLSMTA